MNKTRGPKWFQEMSEAIVFVSNHEPLMFRRRMGRTTVNVAELYEKEHMEETIKKLKELGINFVRTHFYKGFGLKAERQEIEKTKKLTKICHKYGIKVELYVQFNNLMYETFFDEVPEAKDWIQVNQDGKPVALTYGHQTFRYKPCINREEYLKYLEKVLRIGIEEVKADMIGFDNYTLSPEPDSCHCEICKRKFIQFLEEKYPTEAERIERFGFANLKNIQPPIFNLWNPPFTLIEINDPVIQEWINFRCKYMSEAYKRLCEYIRKLNPEVAVELNCHGIYGQNRQYLHGIDHPTLVIHGDLFWTEEPNEAGVTKDGVLVSKIRTYKMGRTLNTPVISYTARKLSMAEALAYNTKTVGLVGGLLYDPSATLEWKPYLDFRQKYAEYYTETETIADAAVLRSYPSLVYNSYSTRLSVILFEQTLIQAKIPFDIIFDNNLKDLSKWKVLVLANQESLSDEQLDLIREYVKNGGGLVATENTSLYNEWRRMRPDYGLADLFGVSYVQRQRRFPRAEAEFTVPPKKRMYGKGRVVYIPKIIPASEPQLTRFGYPFISSRYWKLPINWHELVEAVEWASGNNLSIKVTAPLTVTIELLQQKSKNRIILHLLNYDFEKPVKDIHIELSVPKEKEVEKISLLSPEIEPIENIDFTKKEQKIFFTVPELKMYNLIPIQLKH